MCEAPRTFSKAKASFEKMFDHFISIVSTRQVVLFLIAYSKYNWELCRQIELEAEQKREEKVHTLKKNLKLLMIALIVLAIEKLSEFITALFSSQGPGNPVIITFFIRKLLCIFKFAFMGKFLQEHRFVHILLLPHLDQLNIFMTSTCKYFYDLNL